MQPVIDAAFLVAIQPVGLTFGVSGSSAFPISSVAGWGSLPGGLGSVL
jgi:hypothetical protein